MQSLAGDWRNADLSPADNGLCEFAEHLTERPQHMNQDHIALLRQLGFDDRAIHDAIQVIGYFNYINRVADAIDVDLEDCVRPWGE